jgi:hypothetical protein
MSPVTDGNGQQCSKRRRSGGGGGSSTRGLAAPGAALPDRIAALEEVWGLLREGSACDRIAALEAEVFGEAPSELHLLLPARVAMLEQNTE